VREIWNDLILAERSLIKMLNKKRSKGRACSTPDSTEKGEENFPKTLTKEALSDRQLWN
jgi:hypothetical protein